jgi:hypothetical protein
MFYNLNKFWSLSARATTSLAVIALILLTAPAPSAFSQDAAANAALQQSQNLSQPSDTGPRITPDGMVLPSSGSPEESKCDEDLGEQWMLKHNQRPQPFNIFADVSGFYTSNVALTHKPEFSDSFLVASVGASYSRPFGGIWAFNVGLSESIFRYDTFTDFDFDSFNAGGGISLQSHQLWDTLFSLQYNYNRLTHGATSGELFSGHNFTLSALKSIQLSTADSVSLGVTGSFSVADPASLMWGGGALFASYNLNVTRQLSVGANYRVTFFNYTDTSRFDVNQAISAGAHFNVNRWFSINASISGIFNSSNETAFDYRALNFGGGITGNIRF